MSPAQAKSTDAQLQPPPSPEVQAAFEAATRALRAGQVAQAEQGFRALTRSHPELAGPHANLGLILRLAGKLPEAAQALREATRLSPQQPLYFNQLGIVCRELGQFEQARQAYEQAIALDARQAQAILNLGILHDLYLGDGPQALSLFERYLALTPSGDATVSKWVAELKKRKPAAAKKEAS